MLIKIGIVLFLLAMLVSLFSALYFLVKDNSGTRRTANALTWRVSIWAVLFALLCVGLYTGVIKPSNSLVPPWAKQEQSPVN